MLKLCVPSGRRAPRAVAAAAVFVGAGLLLSAGCVSSGKYKSLEKERNDLSGRNKALQGEVETANQKNDTLTQQNAALEQQKSGLESDRASLSDRLSKLEEQGKSLGVQLQQNEQDATQQKSTYDGLVASLKKELAAGQIQVEQMRDGISVNVAQEILFASGSASLDKNGVEVLQRVAEQLKQTNYQIVVTGHTDNKPIGAGLVKQYPTNWELAGARAASVVRLFAQTGLPASRLVAISLADTHPVSPNDTTEGRAKNRRIEIRMRPIVVGENG
jgi:chemotaxis protein MotB